MLFALAGTTLLQPLITPSVYPLFFMAITLAGWRNGRGAGLYAVALSVMLVEMVLLSPQWVFTIQTVPRAFVFLLCAIPMVLLAARHRQALWATRHSEARLSGVIASAMDAIISVDANQRIILFNTAAERAFRCTADEVMGHAIDRLIPQASRERHRAHIASFANTGVTTRRMEGARLMAVRCDGTQFPIEATISQTALGPVFTVILRDVTVREQAEHALRQSEKMEAVGRLAGGIAHDFNNMLQAIMGNANLLMLDPALPDNASVSVLEIMNASSRAADLTRQLLVFSRRAQFQPHVFDMTRVVHGLRPMLRRLIPENIILDIQANTECRVRADPGQLEQVILNLMVNARDSMGEGGRILIIADTVTDPPSVGLGCYCRLIVQDTGVGMSPDTQEHIFEPFFTTKQEGTGLGLATVYAAVHQCGGTISVDSEPNRGSRFEILLPETHQMTEDPVEAPPRISGPTIARRILVVEDEPMVRLVITRLLREQGYHVVSAATGVEGLQKLAVERVDLVLTDIVMPEMGGREFAKYMGKLYPQLPVLFMSGYPNPNAPGNRGQPVDIQKPVDLMQLVDKVEQRLRDTSGRTPEHQ